MTTQHTPGPWQWVNPRTDVVWSGDGLFNKASLRTVAKFGKDETIVRDGAHYTSFAIPKFILEAECVADDKEGAANARLIAAAPDLLASLREFIKPWEGLEMIEGTVTRARAAIDKATGVAS